MIAVGQTSLFDLDKQECLSYWPRVIGSQHPTTLNFMRQYGRNDILTRAHPDTSPLDSRFRGNDNACGVIYCEVICLNLNLRVVGRPWLITIAVGQTFLFDPDKQECLSYHPRIVGCPHPATIALKMSLRFHPEAHEKCHCEERSDAAICLIYSTASPYSTIYIYKVKPYES